MEKNRYKGIVCIVCSAFCFALMNVFVRAAGDLPSMQKSFFRNVVALAFAIIIMKKNSIPFRCRRKNLRYLLIRSVCGTLGILCNYYAIDHLVLSDASMLNKMSPFFAVIFGFLVLGERVDIPQALCVAGAFLGSLLVIKPTFANMALVPSFIGLLGGLGAGIAYTYVRKATLNGEKGPLVVCFFSAFSCLATLPFLLFDYHPMTVLQLLSLLGAGASAAGGQFAITAAYSYAPAREISVYDYSQVIFAAGLGFVIFGQMPDGLSWLGYAVICTMAVVMFLYNNRKRA
ncbi:MAG: DMT family transporter [Dorea sp.]|nr:DMT family transporter [Dorea sp.]